MYNNELGWYVIKSSEKPLNTMRLQGYFLLYMLDFSLI